MVVTSNSLLTIPESLAVLLFQIRLERPCQALPARPEDLATHSTHALHHLGRHNPLHHFLQAVAVMPALETRCRVRNDGLIFEVQSLRP